MNKYIAALCISVCVPTLSHAEDLSGRIHVYIPAPGKNKIAIALPKPTSTLTAADEFYSVVVNDLTLSGWVEIVDPNTYIEKTGTSVKMGEFQFDNWDSVNAIPLAKTSLSADGNTLRAEVWVYDIPGRKKLGAKAFTGTPKNVRNLGHRVASEIIKQLTGTEGPFNTQFAMVNDVTKHKEIYVMDFDGENLQQITKNKSTNLNPEWSPDNSKIAFTSFLYGNPDIYVANKATGNLTQLSARNGINISPSWHPNGESLVATLSIKGNADIYTLDAKTGQLKSKLTKEPSIDVSPHYSPDGSLITFTSERSGGTQIFVMNADGSNVKRVSFNCGSNNTDPVFSPDGTKIAFVSQTATLDIYIVNVDGSNLTRLTSVGNNEDPTWSPDGNYIAFSSNRDGKSDIWMTTIDGTHQVQLSHGGGNFTNPDWSSALRW